jgi:hypothetical protein
LMGAGDLGGVVEGAGCSSSSVSANEANVLREDLTMFFFLSPTERRPEDRRLLLLDCLLAWLINILGVIFEFYLMKAMIRLAMEGRSLRRQLFLWKEDQKKDQKNGTGLNSGIRREDLAIVLHHHRSDRMACACRIPGFP